MANEIWTITGHPRKRRSEQIVGWFDYEQSAGEVTAGVTPTDKQYPVGDVRRYGAQFDGVTDDYSAINQAIQAVDAGHTGISGWAEATVKLPGGLALISQPLVIPNYVLIEGISPRGTVIRPHGDWSGTELIEFTDGAGTENLFDSGIRNVFLDADSEATITSGILINGLQENTFIQNVLVNNVDGDCINFNSAVGSAHAEVKNCELSPLNGGRGIYVDYSGATLLFERVTVNGPPDAVAGFEVEAGRVTAICCHFEDCTDGIYLAGTNAQVTAISCTGLSTVDSLFHVTGSAQELTAIGCSQAGGTNFIDNDYAGGNVTRSPNFYKFPQEQNFTNDATPSLNNDTPIVTLSASNSTTLTGFDNAYPGQEVNVQFISSSAGANYTVDFTSSNLVGNAGVDWTTSDGDSMHVFFRGGKGYCQISG